MKSAKGGVERNQDRLLGQHQTDQENSEDEFFSWDIETAEPVRWYQREEDGQGGPGGGVKGAVAQEGGKVQPSPDFAVSIEIWCQWEGERASKKLRVWFD